MNALQHRQTADAIDLIEKSANNWKLVQCYAVSSGTWESHDTLEDAQESISSNRILRIKPAPVTRPWSEPEHVPLNCWIRLGGSGFVCLVVAVETCGVHVFTGLWRWEKLQSDEAQHSTDRKTWHKCEVVE